MNTPTKELDEPVTNGTDRVEVMRETMVGDRVFRVQVRYEQGSQIAIEFAGRTTDGEPAGALRGEIAVADLLPAGKSLSTLLPSIAVAFGQAKLSAPLEDLRRAHPNAGRAWSPADDARLSWGFQAGWSISSAAEELGRRPNAIRSRLVRLGLLAPGGSATRSVPSTVPDGPIPT